MQTMQARIFLEHIKAAATKFAEVQIKDMPVIPPECIIIFPDGSRLTISTRTRPEDFHLDIEEIT